MGILTQFLLDQRLTQILPYTKGDVLDLGCGSAPILRKLPATVVYVGVDVYAETVARLRRLYPDRQFICCDLDQETLKINGSFDTILMTAVIEHLYRPELVLSQLSSFLRPDGQLVLTTPTPNGNQIHHIGAKIGFFSKAATEDHKFIFDRSSLEDLLDRCGFKMVHYKHFLMGQNQFCVAKLNKAKVEGAFEG